MNILNLKNKITKFPNSPRVYIFRDKNKKIIYVGKATSLKDRTGSYFVGNAYMRSLQLNRPIKMMIGEVANIEIRKTETVLEAYILEQELIKKFQPKYNVDGKDDKSFSYVIFTKEDFPRILVMRKTDLESGPVIASPAISGINSAKQSRNLKINLAKNEIATVVPIKSGLPRNDMKIYGPYTSKKQIEIALKILRKIFPYYNKKENSEKGCLDFQLGLCPGPYAGAISKSDYQKNIRGIKMILEGKKKNLLSKLKKEMVQYSKKEEFEKAGEVRNKIFALQHIRDVALISDKPHPDPLLIKERGILRIEGYDISNISGKFNVGSMVVFDNIGVETQNFASIQPNKSQYRKFRIKTIDGADDVASMREVLMRRFENNWPAPNLILLDGGAGHLNMARKILKNYKLEIPLLAVAKGPTRKKLDLRSFGSVPEISQILIEQIRNEAHRFAIGYHRKLRGKEFLGAVDN